MGMGFPGVTMQMPGVTIMPGMGMGMGGMGMGGMVMGGYEAYGSGRKVAIRTSYGKYLVAEHDTVGSHHNDHGGKGHFMIKVLYENIVEIKTHHGRHIAMEGYGGLYLSYEHHEYDTKFHMEFIEGRIAFRNIRHGRFIGIDEWGTVSGHYQISPSTLFEEVPVYY